MIRTVLRWVAILYGIYLALILLVVMPALNFVAPKIVKEQTRRELRSELIVVDPFRLAVEARGASIHEATGHVPLALKTLRVNLSLESLTSPGIVLDEFFIDELDVHVRRYADGSFHFDDLIATDAPADDAPSAPPPYLTIDDLSIDAHTLRFTDETRPGPYTTVQRDFQLRTRNVTTVPERQGDGNLELISDGGGVLRWSGEMDIASGRSYGTLTLENVDLTHLWRYNAQDLSFVANSARFGATLNYTVNWSDDLQLLLKESELRLHDIDVVPAAMDENPATGVALGDLRIEDLNLDLQAETVDIARVGIAGLAVEGFDRDGRVSLLSMVPPSEDKTTADETTAAPEDTGESSNWTVTVNELSATDNQVMWKTDYLAPETMVVTPIDLTVREFQWPAESAAPVELTLAINDEVDLTVDGAINVSNGGGNLQISLQRWHLEWLNPLLNAQARTDIRRGSLSVETAIDLADFAPQTVSGGVVLEDLVTELHETGEEAFKMQSLTIDRFETQIPEQIARIDTLTIQGPAGSLHIREDGRMNINGVIRGGPSTSDATEAPTEDEASTPWAFVLRNLKLRDGRLDFADSSLPLPFKTLVEDITADLRDLDSTSEEPLSLELQGMVDGYAPVLIQGGGLPLADVQSGSVRFNFRGIDIATMSPYSGTYAGYAIESGTLTLDLNYALNGQLINGDNRIIISQMALGEPVESDLALDVPLKLGIALLTDSKGVIDLDVPVSGSVDDPEFSLGRVIGRAISNVIVKAVTAPFSLLAGLVGSDEDLENIPFTVGSDAADDAALGALASLGEALTSRPQLLLQIGGGFDAVTDGFALREQALTAELTAGGLSAESVAARDEAFTDEVGQRYRAATSTADSVEEDAEQAEEPALEDQWRSLVRRQELPPSALADLATSRAAAAKRILVTEHGIDAARIAISRDDTLGTAGVRMALDG